MSIKAYATVRLTGCNIRRFINLCTANHIKIWNLKYVSPKEYCLLYTSDAADE